ncbi:MAG: class I SAM-dependent methyltransferase [Pseudomonadota bacterium]
MPQSTQTGRPVPRGDDPDDRPLVKLRPNKGRRLMAGSPWVYADEIAMDRRTRALPPGSLARLTDGERMFGLVAVNAESQIAGRLIDADAEAVVDVDWFARRLSRALARRQRLGAGAAAPVDPAFCRLVHAEGDALSGLVIDRFGQAVVIQPNAAWIDARIEALVAALDRVLPEPPRTVIVNAQSRVRRLEGLDTGLSMLRGDDDAPVEVAMNGAVYLADLTGGQKTGLFYDQRTNHAMAARLAGGRAVLDVFAHVGGFGLACLGAEPAAERVVAIDSSTPALALAREGAARMGMTARFETRAADAFDALAAAAEAGDRYGLVICDPPAFAPHRKAVDAGLRAYEKTARLAARVVAPGGSLVLCSCSGAVSGEAFREASVRGIQAAGRTGALIHLGRAGPDHPQHMALPETGYLKALFFDLDG